MKKINSIFAGIAALCLAATVVPLSSAALYTESSGNYDGFTKLDDFSLFSNSTEYFTDLYVNSDGTEFIMTKDLDDIILFNPTENVTASQISSAISSYRTENGFAYSAYSRAYTGYRHDLKFCISAATGISSNDAREIGAVLKEKGLVKDFVLMSGRVTESHCYAPYLTSYFCFGSEREVLQSYIVDNGLDFYISDYYEAERSPIYQEYWEEGVIYLYPNYDISLEEHLKIAEQIYADTGIGTMHSSPASINSDNANDIDILDAVDGDANNNGLVELSDAVAVMQALANPDKFSLSPQGNYNADVNGDGITALDALIIQRQILNLEE